MAILEITAAVIGGLFSAGVAIGAAMKGKALQDIGQNDVTQTDCAALCSQLRARHNEFCLGQADEASARRKYQQAAIASAGAAASALALSIAAQAAAASVFGIVVAAVLAAAAVVAAGLAVVAAGITSSLFLKWTEADSVLSSVRAAFLQAQEQIIRQCSADQANACINALPNCPT